ncbi:DUF3108 domain-containing protein [Gemmobacter sp. LW-1]|uniref:DUF3108 domain-containing protein n=1 Tax=Gemmobacter sp. LW-1 TaxID=1529005 RepID=UPI001F488B5D|nr:DUF3108 domain-containing protein [Gemmobacter sp. LW-1]
MKAGISRALCAGLMAAAVMAAPARAEQAQFDFVLKGITAGSLTWSGEGLPGGGYAVAGRLQTTGLAALLKKVRYDAKSRGRITAKGSYQPQSYTEDADTGRRQSQVVMTWASGIPTIKTYNPPRNPRPYDIDPAAQKGSVDPLTAMFATLRDVKAGEECRVSVNMFDGRRASRLSLSAPKANGDKVICAGEYRRVAGFSPEDMAEKTRFPFTLTYEPAGNGMMRVVEVATDTLYGKARLVRR